VNRGLLLRKGKGVSGDPYRFGIADGKSAEICQMAGGNFQVECAEGGFTQFG
jgi:hypothetical protein